MAWTRVSERRLDGSHFGLVFVELRTRLLRIRFSPNKSSRRLVEGGEWLQNFVRRTALSGLLELLGDSGMLWTVPGRARDLNTAEVEAYANYFEPSTNFEPGAQSHHMAERGQKRLLLLVNLNLHFGRLGKAGWQGLCVFPAAEAQLDFHPMPWSAVPGLRDMCRY